MHAIEKLLAAKAGKVSTKTGEIINCLIDLAGINDLYLQTLRSFAEIGGKKVKYPDRIVVFLDHYAPASTILQAENQKIFREFCKEQKIERLMDVNQGVCHQVAIDNLYTKPGMLIVITDSHTTTHGALGAFGTGVGATDMATVLLTGELWFRVPEIIHITLEGSLQKGVFAKDVILYIIGKLKADYGVYRAIEFAGPVIDVFSVSERLTICNMTTEMGAKTAWIKPDNVTFSFLKQHGVAADGIFTTDPDYQYFARHTFDVSKISPQIAAPHSVDNVFPLEEYEGIHVDQAFLGTCTGGRLEDLEVAARILKGKSIFPGTRFLVVPASRNVLLTAMERGILRILVEAGATLVTPGCAACLGTHEGMIAPGEVCITSSSRNFPGRMGSREGEIFVASPASVAVAALTGHITDPARFLFDNQ
jgi:3-isopropylmalate/(R)-2-methylmalate dehydratase large subunit